MSRILSIFLLVMVAPVLASPLVTSAAQAAEPISVPARLSDDGHFLVDATLDGAGPFTFIVDTAAQSSVVFDSFALEVNLPPVEGLENVRVQGASGVMEARMVNLDSLTVADWQFDVGPTVAIPDIDHLTSSAGILGVNVLFNQPIGFDAANSQLDIYVQGENFVPQSDDADAWSSVGVSRGHGPILRSQVVIDGVPFDAVIDTGARRSTINLAGAAALGIVDPAIAGLAEEEPVRGATGHPEPAWTLDVNTVSLGDVTWADADVTIADMAIFSMMGNNEMPIIVLGADYLLRQYLVVDSDADLLWFRTEG